MKVTYEPEADVLTMEIEPGLAIDHAQEAGPFVVHLSADGRVALIEVLDASRVLTALVRAGLRQSEDYPLASEPV